jgi:hypothetical protein
MKGSGGDTASTCEEKNIEERVEAKG